MRPVVSTQWRTREFLAPFNSAENPVAEPPGAREASLLTASVPNTLTADVAHATTIDQGDRSESEAAIADLNLAVGGNAVSATFVSSQAKALCGASGPAASGSAEISHLALNQQPVLVTGEPNQQVTLANLRMILNEQTPDPTSANHAGLTANGLHLIASGRASTCRGGPTTTPSRSLRASCSCSSAAASMVRAGV